MSRHIIDHGDRATDGSRVLRFLRINRSEARHPAITQLLRRPRARPDAGGRVPALQRVQRGQPV